MSDTAPALVLENAHTGEILRMVRYERPGGGRLELEGMIPRGRASMAVHLHRVEDLDVTVRLGTLSLIVHDRRGELTEGKSLRIPRGSAYRFWNEGPGPVRYAASVDPVVDMDRYLEAVFQVINSSPKDKPSLTYLAKVMLAHRKTQTVRLLSWPFQDPLLWGVVLTGTLTGRYRGHDWPGDPAGLHGAPHLPEPSP
jgi:hypothetical protein